MKKRLNLLLILPMCLLSLSVFSAQKANSDKPQKRTQSIQKNIDFPLGVAVKKRVFMLANNPKNTLLFERFLKQSNLENKAFLIIPGSTQMPYQHVLNNLKRHNINDRQIQVRFDLNQANGVKKHQLMVKVEEFTVVTKGCDSSQIGCATQSNYLLMLDNPREIYRANKSQHIDARSVLKKLDKLEKKRPQIGNNQANNGGN